MKTMTLFAAALIAGFSGAVASAAPQPSSQGRTRAEVRSETAEAVRTGDIPSGFEGLRMNELLPEMYRRAPQIADGATSAASATTVVEQRSSRAARQ
jgi:hypothetical protein